jgi:hypothetical protein
MRYRFPMTLLTRLIEAFRIRTPWAPGVIRGGKGRLPSRIALPFAQRAKARREVARLLERMSKA